MHSRDGVLEKARTRTFLEKARTQTFYFKNVRYTDYFGLQKGKTKQITIAVIQSALCKVACEQNTRGFKFFAIQI